MVSMRGNFYPHNHFSDPGECGYAPKWGLAAQRLDDSTAAYPSLVSGYSWCKGQIRISSLLEFDPQGRTLAPVEWPTEFAPIKQTIEARLESAAASAVERLAELRVTVRLSLLSRPYRTFRETALLCATPSTLVTDLAEATGEGNQQGFGKWGSYGSGTASAAGLRSSNSTKVLYDDFSRRLLLVIFLLVQTPISGSNLSSSPQIVASYLNQIPLSATRKCKNPICECHCFVRTQRGARGRARGLRIFNNAVPTDWRTQLARIRIYRRHCAVCRWQATGSCWSRIDQDPWMLPSHRCEIAIWR